MSARCRVRWLRPVAAVLLTFVLDIGTAAATSAVQPDCASGILDAASQDDVCVATADSHLESGELTELGGVSGCLSGVDRAAGSAYRADFARPPPAGPASHDYDSIANSTNPAADGGRVCRASSGTEADRVAPQTTRAAAGVADDALPAALRGGTPDVHVYHGASQGKNVYVGITNDVARRQGQHGSRFLMDPITSSPLTRGQARAVEEALFMRNPGFQNIRHPISPSHSWYQDALNWGESWLGRNGL